MKLIIFFLFALATQFVSAQNVGIGTTTPNSSAMLDVVSTNKGLLVPRVALTGANDVVTIPSPAVSLLVYNTATAGGVTPGFYYWVGTTWLRLNTGSGLSNAWLLNGNAGTIDGTHFIGTTDNVALSFRQNNKWLGRWDSGTSNYFIGDSAGIANSSGISNVGIGTRALQKNTTAFGNVAIGNHTLQNNTAGRGNTAIGDSALFEQSFSSNLITDNTALGNNALRYNNPTSGTNGFRNVAVGNNAMYNNTTGFSNVATGFGALRNNLTGSGNTTMGYLAHWQSKSGDVNTYVGYLTGFSDSSGNGNTGMGAYSLYAHVSGGANTAIGYDALRNDSSGSKNTAIGSYASTNSDTGQLNTAVGYYSLANNSRSFITAVGAHAGRFNGYEGTNTQGLENTMIGYAAMTGNHLGSQNTAIGYKAMAITEPGSYALNVNPSRNVAIGDSAMQRNTGNDNVGIGFRALGGPLGQNGSKANVAIGTNAMFGNISGGGNVAIGHQALNESEASTFNVAIGSYAMLNHKRTGFTYNVAVGSSALEQDSSGFQNTGVGTSSFRFNNSGSYNCGLGINSGYYQKGSNNTFAGAYSGFGERINPANLVLNTGSNNAGLGGGSLYNLANGNFNVAIGEDALFADSSGSYNAAVGNDALRNITTGSYNSGLGYSTNVSAGTFTNTTTIGAYAYATQSNSLILGGINGVNGAIANTSVGIGTTAPAARLHVADSSVLFSATGIVPPIPGNPPVQGGGRRMMWYADKAAFRAGYINGNQWDKDNIGNWSMALGRMTTASGDASTAIGTRTTASGDYSTSMGDSTVASGTVSFASGLRSNATGNYSTALGAETIASGDYSTAMGFQTTASGDYSTAMGNNSAANGRVSNATGIGLQARGYAGTVIGMYNDPIVPIQTAPTTTTPLFMIGNGSAFNLLSNAMVVLKNGNVGIGTNAPAARLDVDANFKLGANGTVLNDIIKSTETYDIPNLAPGAVDIQTFTVPNVNLGSAVSISPLLALPDGITISYARVSAAGIVEVKVVNAGAAAQNPASMSFIIAVIR